MIRLLLAAAVLTAPLSAWPQAFSDQSILSLPVAAELPPRVFESRDTRALAELLVQRLALLRPRPPATGSYIDRPMAAIGPVGVHVYCLRRYLKSIVAQGYLNQYQIGHSIGRFDPQARMKNEDSMIGLRLGDALAPGPQRDHIRELRPKYGLVDFSAPEDIVVDPYDDAQQYGDGGGEACGGQTA